MSNIETRLVYKSGGQPNSGILISAKKKPSGWDRTAAAEKGWETRRARSKAETDAKNANQESKYRAAYRALEHIVFDHPEGDFSPEVLRKFSAGIEAGCFYAISEAKKFDIFQLAANVVNHVKTPDLLRQWQLKFREYYRGSLSSAVLDWYAELPEGYVLFRNYKTEWLSKQWMNTWQYLKEDYSDTNDSFRDFFRRSEAERRISSFADSKMAALEHPSAAVRQAALETLTVCMKEGGLAPNQLSRSSRILRHDTDPLVAAAAQGLRLALAKKITQERQKFRKEVRTLREGLFARCSKRLDSPS